MNGVPVVPFRYPVGGSAANAKVADLFTKIAECLMMDWNDLRYLLAVSRTGTTLAASRELGVSQSTVARRISALETALGLSLFERRQSGYVLTGDGLEILSAAEAAGAAVNDFISKAAARKRGLFGTVRLTTNELFATVLLINALRDFPTAYPGLRLEVITTDMSLDLASGQADVALRAGRPPSQPDLVGRRIGKDTWSVYCSRDYASAHGSPASEDDLGAHHVIGIDHGSFAGPIADWSRAHVPASAIKLRQSSVNALYTSIKRGLGVSLMSDFVAAGDPEMVRCFTPKIEHDYEIWLLTHERLRNAPHVRAVLDFLSGYFAARH